MQGSLSLGIGEILSALGILLVFYHQIYSLNNSVGNTSDSIKDIRDEIKQVDLKALERNVSKVTYNLTDETVDGGNSVDYELKKCDNNVTISLASDVPDSELVKNYMSALTDEIDLDEILAESIGTSDLDMDSMRELSEEREDVHFHDEKDDFFADEDEENIPDEDEFAGGVEIKIDEQDFLDIEGMNIEIDINEEGGLEYQLQPTDMTVVHFDFTNRINVKSVVGRMNSDDEVEELERELFKHEGIFRDQSPFEISYMIASDDYDKLAELIDVLVDKIEEYHQAFEKESDEFDRAVEKKLFNK
jgi:hypothetical protein